MSIKQKEFVEELRVEWKRLWRERIDDKVRAEGIALNDYNQLFVDKGTIIHATRDFKALNFKEILEEHEVLNAERFIPPDPHVGGWTKFVKMNITSQKSQRKRLQPDSEVKKERQQFKKNGRGWLHI
ncbi:MAG: hypothetical protein ABSG33_04795 [Candidatus Bathyarchaeia archaeon]|jgi:hypothetical protein